MKKTQFDKLVTQLKERGYKIYNQQWHHEDYVLGKSFHRDDNRWDEDREGFQLLLYVYDYTLHPEWYDRIAKLTGTSKNTVITVARLLGLTHDQQQPTVTIHEQIEN